MTPTARPDPSYSIRQLCREFGATPRALRFYEDKGLLSPERQGVTRVYSGRDRARLGLILQGKRVGFGLAEIGEMLDLYDRRDGRITQMAVSLSRFRKRIDALRAQRDDIDSAIETLEQGCDWLEARLAAAPAVEDGSGLPIAGDYDSFLRARLDEPSEEPGGGPVFL